MPTRLPPRTFPQLCLCGLNVQIDEGARVAECIWPRHLDVEHSPEGFEAVAQMILRNLRREAGDVQPLHNSGLAHVESSTLLLPDQIKGRRLKDARAILSTDWRNCVGVTPANDVRI